jgi:hypothetical protein
MPYIKQPDRSRLDPAIDALAKLIIPEQRAGEINYSINQLLLKLEGEGKYRDFNELLGALEAAKLEFYRRRVAPYEDKKIAENGDLEGYNKK